MSATFTSTAAARSADAFPPPPLTTLAQLLAELNLPQPATDTLLSLNACAATLSANGRPVLLKLLAREGFVAGHAQKIATAVARELRSKRIAFDASEAIALPPSPAIASFISSPSVESAVAAGDALKLATALRAMDGRLPPRSCLATASKHGHTECVALLLSHNADPDAVGSDHLSPLHHASRRKHIEIVTQLIAAKASINLAVTGGSTPLHAASASGHHEVVSLLCEANADVNAARPDGSMPLMDAMQQGSVECARTLLSHGAQADARMHHGWTALLVSAVGGHHECIRLLFSKSSVEVDECDVDGTSALSLASQRGHYECVSTLLSANANPNTQRADGLSPLHYACMNGHASCVSMLLEAKAEVECRDTSDWSPLLYASYEGHLDCVTKIMEDGHASVDAARSTGFTPLMAACASGHPKVIKLLIGLKADAMITKPSPCYVANAYEHARRGAAPAECIAALGMSGGAAEEEEEVVLDGHLVFHRLPYLRSDECWQERPPRTRKGMEELSYLTNSTTPHGINIIHTIMRGHGITRVNDNTPSSSSWSLFWCGGPLDVRTVHSLLPHQKVSKFPNSKCLTLKANLWKAYQHMRSVHGITHYDYMPTTYTLPEEYQAWRQHLRAEHSTSSSTPSWWIVKPNNASRSRGVFLTNASLLEAEEKEAEEVSNVCGVACSYLPPFLIDNLKFDLRLYCLVTSWSPLIIYLYEEGIARFATHTYQQPDSTNRKEVDLHLTNATCNPNAKRLMFSQLKSRLLDEMGEDACTKLWRAIDDLIVKTMLSVEGTMHTALSSCSLPVATGLPNTSCFQLFGLDVMIDEKCKPWLLEVNLDPSLQMGDMIGTPQGANVQLKEGMVVGVLNLIGLQPPSPPGKEEDLAERARRRSPEEVREAALRHVIAEYKRSIGTGWRRLMPSSSCGDRYLPFVAAARREANDVSRFLAW